MARTKESVGAVLTYPGPGGGPAEPRKTFLTHESDPFEVQLGGNTLLVPSGTVEIRSDSPHFTPLQVAHHIAAQASKRGAYTIEEK